MFSIRICIVHLILVTWNDWRAEIICRFFAESNDCWRGNKTTTKKDLKLTSYPNICKEILTNQIQKKTSTKQYLKMHLYPKSPSKGNLYQKQFQEKSPPKKQVVFDMKNCKNPNLWKFNIHALFHQISSVLIFAMFLVMFFSQIFWWRCFIRFSRDFSSDVFFCRDFSSICLVGKCLYFLVEIVLQMFILQGMSLQSFLGRILRENFWLE